MRKNATLLLLLTVLTGCYQKAPQIPSYRSGQSSTADTSLLQAIEINRHLAEEADRQLARSVHEGYALTETGYWAKGLRYEESPLQEGQQVQLHLQVYQTDSTLLTDDRMTVTVGRTELPDAVTDALLQMNPHQQASLLVPWYLGYGSTGTPHVPPYTNLRIELETTP